MTRSKNHARGATRPLKNGDGRRLDIATVSSPMATGGKYPYDLGRQLDSTEYDVWDRLLERIGRAALVAGISNIRLMQTQNVLTSVVESQQLQAAAKLGPSALNALLTRTRNTTETAKKDEPITAKFKELSIYRARLFAKVDSPDIRDNQEKIAEALSYHPSIPPQRREFNGTSTLTLARFSEELTIGQKINVLHNVQNDTPEPGSPIALARLEVIHLANMHYRIL